MDTGQFTELQQAVLTGGVRRTNFFNGRVLTADDLRTEQTAAHAELAWLGSAVGEGVAWGYEISWGTEPAAGGGATNHTVLRIERGFALNRLGEGVALGASAQLRLVRDAPSARAGNDFASCTGGVATLTNPGLYILTAAPTTAYEGSAPAVALDEGADTAPCASGFAVETVYFGLTPVDLTSATGLAAEAQAKLTTAVSALDAGSITADVSLFRSCIAHHFLGSDRARVPANPFPSKGSGGYPVAPVAPAPLDQLFEQELLDPAAVPLALLYWSKNGVQFVDWWAVRRPVSALPASAAWAPLVGGRDAALGLARFLQFQQQLDWLPADLRRTNPAVALFRYLPAAGLLWTSDFVGGVASFLGELHTGGPTPITAAQLEPLVRDALGLPALDLPSHAARYRIQRYRVEDAGYEVFATRALHGVLESDAVATVFSDTWHAYQDLSSAFVERMSSFLGPSSLPAGGLVGGDASLDIVRATLVELFTINAVTQAASSSLVLATGRHLDHARAADMLLALAEWEQRVAEGLQREFDNAHLQARGQDLLSKVQALRSVCSLGELQSAVLNQKAINDLIATLTGELPTTLVLTGTITGTVQGSRGTIPYARVAVVGLALAATTDYAGRYRLDNVPAGTRMVEVPSAGTSNVRKTVVVPAGGSVTADFYL